MTNERFERGLEDFQTVLLQCAAYAGVPAANSAYHQALEVYAELDQEQA